jgi:hypothetical protein
MDNYGEILIEIQFTTLHEAKVSCWLIKIFPFLVVKMLYYYDFSIPCCQNALALKVPAE